MKKKIVNVVLFLAVLAAALGMTFYVGNNAMSVLLYNFVFLGIIAVVYVVGLFGGMFRMNRLAQSLGDAAQELEDMFKMPGRVAPDKIESMNGIFHNHYLDAKMKAFTDGIAKSQEGIVDIEEYINEEDLDLHIHKKLLEMAPRTVAFRVNNAHIRPQKTVDKVISVHGRFLISASKHQTGI